MEHLSPVAPFVFTKLHRLWLNFGVRPILGGVSLDTAVLQALEVSYKAQMSKCKYLCWDKISQALNMNATSVQTMLSWVETTTRVKLQCKDMDKIISCAQYPQISCITFTPCFSFRTVQAISSPYFLEESVKCVPWDKKGKVIIKGLNFYRLQRRFMFHQF